MGYHEYVHGAYYGLKYQASQKRYLEVTVLPSWGCGYPRNKEKWFARPFSISCSWTISAFVEVLCFREGYVYTRP